MKNKILYFFIFLFVFLFTSFLFSEKVYAYTKPEINYNPSDLFSIENYSVKNVSNDTLNSFLTFLQDFPAYKTGDYYYLIYFNMYNSLSCLLLNKSQFDSVEYGGFSSELVNRANMYVYLSIFNDLNNQIVGGSVKDMYYYSGSGDFSYSNFKTNYGNISDYGSKGDPFKIRCLTLDDLTLNVSFLTDIPYDFYFTNVAGTTIIPSEVDKNTKPFIGNWNQIKTGIFDHIFVYTGSKYTVSDNIKFDVLETEPYYSDSGEFYGYYGTTQKRRILNSDSPYLSDYFVSADLGGMYMVPRSVFFDLKTDYRYEFRLTVNGEKVFDEFFVMGEISPEKQEQYEKDKQNALQEEQNDLLKEQNETNKGIWDTLKDVLSYINPFSENFFVYKLIELLIEGLKALFIPSEDFFNNFATDMNEWLSERLGILYYPIDLVVSFLEKISELADSKTAVIRWPNFEFMGADLLKAGSYDLYSLINENETFKNIHSIYLVFTDVILWLGLVFLAKNTFVDVFGGKYDVDDVVESSSIHDNRTLAKNIRLKEERRYRRGRLR